MSDPETGDKGTPEPCLTIRYPEDENGGVEIVTDARQIAENYGAKIISYDYDQPIENAFRLFG